MFCLTHASLLHLLDLRVLVALLLIIEAVECEPTIAAGLLSLTLYGLVIVVLLSTLGLFGSGFEFSLHVFRKKWPF